MKLNSDDNVVDDDEVDVDVPVVVLLKENKIGNENEWTLFMYIHKYGTYVMRNNDREDIV